MLTGYVVDGVEHPIQYTPDELPTMPTLPGETEPMPYFHIGNPYKYDGWKYTWIAGRRLDKMEHAVSGGLNEDGEPLPDTVDKTIEFQYDAAGLRTQKKFTYRNEDHEEVIEITDYFLHGKLLMHLKKTVEVSGVQLSEPRRLHFFYDKDAQPVMVRMGGDEAECAYFTFVKNLQGDVWTSLPYVMGTGDINLYSYIANDSIKFYIPGK